MAVAFARLKTRYPTVDTLSLGMSDDMEAAIAAGSTMVRIGTAILVRATTANNKESEERHEDVDFPAFNGH
nr:Predicted enzyme with a TIM-barrel fold [Klebsiella pneumoniae]